MTADSAGSLLEGELHTRGCRVSVPDALDGAELCGPAGPPAAGAAA